MMHVLSEAEYKLYTANKKVEMEKWWSELSFHDKERLHDQAKLLKQIKCVHDLKETAYYSEKMLYCTKCEYRQQP
jgi:hypothetical protein